MPVSYSFSDFESQSNESGRPSRPIWALNLDDDSEACQKEVLKWLMGEYTFIQEQDQGRQRDVQKNVHLYKGLYYFDQRNRYYRDDPRTYTRYKKPNKIVANHLFDLTEQRVSRQVKFKPAVAVLPTHDEYKDRISAKSTQAWLDHIQYEENFSEGKAEKISRHNSVTGEAYLFIEWDKKAGEVHPDAVGETEKVPLLGENGEIEKDLTGKPIYIEDEIHVGDVKYRLARTWDMFLERKEDFDECNYAFERDVVPVEELRKRYPDHASKIKATREGQIYDFQMMRMRRLDNETVVYKFYHKSNEFMEGGRYIMFTPDVILENEKSMYEHGEFPFVRLTDIDVPGERHGVSFYNTVRDLTTQYNNLTNMVVKAQALMAHAKWVMPAGACKLESLGNDHTIVQYKGPTPPQMIQTNPTPNEVFKFRDGLKEEFQQISGVFGVSRGEPPAGVKAGVAIQFLDEQENERSNSQILKWNDFVRRVALKTISVAGQFYDESDKRTIRVMGKNNEWMMKEFDPEDLTRDYDVRIQNTSALPRSKAARIQTLLDLNESFPEQVTPEQVLDMLDFSQEQKFINSATVAVKSAESENDKILDGEGKGDVEEYEDHITHWDIHTRDIQSQAFKMHTPSKVQKDMKDHIRAHEMFMVQKAKTSPVFAQKLMTLEMFPIFYELPPGETDVLAPGLGAPAEGIPVEGSAGPLGEQQPVAGPVPPISDQGGLEAVTPEAAPLAPGV